MRVNPFLQNAIHWRIIPFNYFSASNNMAIDEAIFRLYDKFRINTVRFYGWKPSSVSIGKNQQIKVEVNLENVEKYKYDCVRRISGGGAVFHDEKGELTYSIITDSRYLESKDIEGSYYEIINLIFAPLKELGLMIDFDQIHCPSVFSEGKKISGNAQARQGGILLQHGTILINIHPEIMYSVLRVNPRKTKSNMIASVYQNITSINEKLAQSFSPDTLASLIIEKLETSNFAVGRLNSEELQLAHTLQKKKYGNNDWTFSK